MTADVPGLDLPRLHEYFTDRVPGYSGSLQARLLPGGRSNLTYRLDDGRTSWVLRRPPLGTLTPSAHDVGREYRIMAALGQTGVPVPETIALYEATDVLGVPFSLVSYVHGRTLRTRGDLAELTPQAVRDSAHELVDVLARLHQVDYRQVGLADAGRPDGYLRRQVRRWRDQWSRVATRELPDIDTLHERLTATVPEHSAAAIVHGDVRIDNAIFAHDDQSSIKALIDWEMATIGDPLADVGLMLVYRDPVVDLVLGHASAATSDAMPSPDELAEQYVRASGRDLSRLDFYVALGYFKLAVIAEGIHERFTAGLTVGEGFDRVGEAVPALLATGLAAGS